MNFFSRGSTPPPAASSQSQTQNPAPMASQTQGISEPPSHVIHSPLPSRPSPVQPASTIDELLKGFHTTPPPPPAEVSQTPPLPTQINSSQAAPAPVQLPPQQPTQQTSQERGNIDLLALLSNAAVTSTPSSVTSSQPVQKPTSAPDQANAGRMLLDSLLSSSGAPPHKPAEVERTFQPAPQPEQIQQQQSRKTAFDFVSPMDIFQQPPQNVSPSNVLSNRKPSETSESYPGSIPAPMSTSSPMHGGGAPSETAVASQDGSQDDPTKRKSIDLLEQLTRTAPLTHQPVSSEPSTIPSSTLNYTSALPPPLSTYRPPPKAPSPQPTFARDQSPALLGQTPPSTSPALSLGGPTIPNQNLPPPQARASPTLKGRGPPAAVGKKDWKKSNGNDFFKSRSPAGPQSFTLDLSLPLAATTASSDRLHITPIALLKLESIYVPGCTIGVSHWIAYAMTKGRVRLIARANGARALLKLPGTFSPNSSIVDLVTSGNRLAGVTSDGGFVVWEVPPMVDDDIPSLLLVSVPPNTTNPYKSIKWHPTDPDVLALATKNEVHLVNVQRLYNMHGGDSISQSVLVSDAEIFPASSSAINSLGGMGPAGFKQEQQIAAFSFDPSQNALVTISQDGTLNMWSIGSQQPPSYQAQQSYNSYVQQNQTLLWTGEIPGDGAPSSLFFMDQGQGVIIGRKRNTIIQLVSPKSTNVQANVRFVHGNGVFGNGASIPDTPDFFAHLAYDSRIRCIWAASSHRSSLMSLRIAAPELSSKPGVDAPLHFEQILDFPILHPTISLGILVSSEGNDVEEMERGSSGMDVASGAVPTGPGGEMSMALVAYVIHSGGVDQVLIGKQDLEIASQTALAKLPPVQNPPSQVARQESPSTLGGIVNTAAMPTHPSGPRELTKKNQPTTAPAYTEPLPSFGTSAPSSTLPPARNFGPMDTNTPQRPRTPTSDVDADLAENTTDVRQGEGGKRGGRRKKGQNQDRSSGLESGFASDVSTSILKEIQRVEDGIQSKISSVVTREFRDQQRRLEQMHEQERFNVAEFQDRLSKNLSNELVKSTGRVFEAALKTEVQRTILPALEVMTKNEVRQALDSQIVRGIGESMNHTLPNEIERLLLRPDVSNHVARTFSSAVTPIIERHVKESINRTLIPSYQQSTTEMYDQLYREINEEILNLRKEIVTWQSDALKNHESLLREMELSIRSLTEQVKTLTSQRSGTPYHVQSHRSSPAPIPVHLRQPSNNYPQMDKMANISSWQQISSTAKPDIPPSQGIGNIPPQPLHQTSLPPAPLNPPNQYSQPQGMQPLGIQAQPPQAPQYRHETPTEDWERIFLQALSNPDIRALRDVLTHAPADKVMPLNGTLLVTQTIILSVIHKVAGCLADVETLEEAISLLWWLTRCSQVLDAHDRIIHDYLDKMLSGIQENLFRAIPRFANAGPQYNRQLSDLLQTLVIKAHNQGV